MEVDLDDGPLPIYEGSAEFERFMRSQYPIDDTTCKPVVTILSNVVQDVQPHMTCPNDLGGIDNLVKPVQDLLGYVCADSFQRASSFFDLEDIEEVSPAPVRLLLDEFKEFLEYDHIPLNVREKQSEISKAYVAPLIGFLNKEISSKSRSLNVLILGAGEGKDIRRLLTTVVSPMTIVAVEPDEEAAKVLRATYPDVTLYNATVNDCLYKLYAHEHFDFILANMSFHYVMGVESAPKVVKFIEEHLSSDGVFFGSYIDVPSVKQSGMIQCLKNGHSVTFLGESQRLLYGEKPVFGVATISVAGKLWEDPYFDVAYVYELFSGSRLAINVYTGHDMVIGPDNAKPLVSIKGFINAMRRPELNMYRCVIANRVLKPVVVPFSPPISFVDTRETGLVERAKAVMFNKGTPLQPWESQFVHEAGCWIADKKDGVAAKLVYVDGGLIVLVKDRVLKIPDFRNQLQMGFLLQVELLETSSPQAFVVDGNRRFWIVVTDVLVAPWGKSGSFLSRWKWLEDLWLNHKPYIKENGKTTYYDWPFVLQRWYTLTDPEAMKMAFEAKEGIVIQGLLAPPSAIKNNAGSAHYVKRVWTIDVIGPKGIEERELLTNKFVRDRPDKSKPNPPSVIEKIVSAVKYEEFLVYMITRVVGVMDASATRVVKNVLKGYHMSLWQPGDLVWAYYHKHDPVINTILPEFGRYLDITFAEFCTARAQLKFVDSKPVLPDVIPDAEYRYIDADGNRRVEFVKGNADEIVKLMMGSVPPVFPAIKVGNIRFEGAPSNIWHESLAMLVERNRCHN